MRVHQLERIPSRRQCHCVTVAKGGGNSSFYYKYSLHAATFNFQSSILSELTESRESRKTTAIGIHENRIFKFATVTLGIQPNHSVYLGNPFQLPRPTLVRPPSHFHLSCSLLKVSRILLPSGTPYKEELKPLHPQRAIQHILPTSKSTQSSYVPQFRFTPFFLAARVLSRFSKKLPRPFLWKHPIRNPDFLHSSIHYFT